MVLSLWLLLVVGCPTSRSTETTAAPKNEQHKAKARTKPVEQKPETKADATPGVSEADLRALALGREGEQAMRLLLTAPFFGGSAVGVAGTPSEPIRALRALAKDPAASRAFELLVKRANLEGQLLGLCGLWSTDRARFDALLPRFRAMRDHKVRVRDNGCNPTLRTVPVPQILEHGQGARLTGPEDNLAKWSSRNPGKPIHHDIAGGGYPSMFLR